MVCDCLSDSACSNSRGVSDGFNPAPCNRRVPIGFVFNIAGLTLIGALTGHLIPWPVTDALYLPLTGLTSWYLVRHAGRSQNELVKIAFVLGMLLIFVPIDIIIEIGGDIGVFFYTALIIGLLTRLRRRVKQADKPLIPTLGNDIGRDCGPEG